MELLPNGDILITRNEAIMVCREAHQKYARAKRYHDWYVEYLARYPNNTNPRNMIKKEKYRGIMAKYYQWENLYELMFRNKKVKNNGIEKTDNPS